MSDLTRKLTNAFKTVTNPSNRGTVGIVAAAGASALSLTAAIAMTATGVTNPIELGITMGAAAALAGGAVGYKLSL